jgi:hypothetical protein
MSTYRRDLDIVDVEPGIHTAVRGGPLDSHGQQAQAELHAWAMISGKRQIASLRMKLELDVDEMAYLGDLATKDYGLVNSPAAKQVKVDSLADALVLSEKFYHRLISPKNFGAANEIIREHGAGELPQVTYHLQETSTFKAAKRLVAYTDRPWMGIQPVSKVGDTDMCIACFTRCVFTGPVYYFDWSE